MAKLSLALLDARVVVFSLFGLVLGMLLGRASQPTSYPSCPLPSIKTAQLSELRSHNVDPGGVLSEWPTQVCPPCPTIPTVQCGKVQACIKRDEKKMVEYGSLAKGVPLPAKERVNGLLIEELTPELQFRPAYAHGHTDDCEDPSHLIPWLLGNQVDLNAASRRIYLDLGAAAFNSSIEWFMRNYPVDFDEIHAFEIKSNLFQPPYDVLARLPHPPKVTSYQMKVGVVNEANSTLKVPSIDILGFISGQLKVRKEDALIVKMDIEGGEWDVLPALLRDAAALQLIDELFVEIHYGDPILKACGWDQFYPRTLEEALSLVDKLRKAGLRTHFWP